MTSDEAETVVNDWVLGVMTGDPTATVPNLMKVLLHTPDLDEIRARVSGLHFAKEALTEREQEVLKLAEDLLALIDHMEVDVQ